MIEKEINISWLPWGKAQHSENAVKLFKLTNKALCDAVPAVLWKRLKAMAASEVCCCLSSAIASSIDSEVKFSLAQRALLYSPSVITGIIFSVCGARLYSQVMGWARCIKDNDAYLLKRDWSVVSRALREKNIVPPSKVIKIQLSLQAKRNG